MAPAITTVDEASLSAKQLQCPVCQSAYPTAGGKRVLDLQQSPSVKLVTCSTCQAMSADRLPSPDFLTELYNPVHYEGTLSSNPALTAACAKRIVDNFDFSPKSGKTHWHIVDYGGGNGELARAVATLIRQKNTAATTQTTVVDVFDQVTEGGQSAFCSADDFLKGQLAGYDVMIASAVLEHIPNLQPILAQMMTSASPNAYLYGRTPYEAPLAKVLPGYSIRWPRHIHDLGPEFWEGLTTQFANQCQLLKSQPSLVETSLAQQPLRTLAAYVLKFPAVIEAKIRQTLKIPTCMWRWVGGWEAYLLVNPKPSSVQ